MTEEMKAGEVIQPTLKIIAVGDSVWPQKNGGSDSWAAKVAAALLVSPSPAPTSAENAQVADGGARYAAIGETSTEGPRWYIWRSGGGASYVGGKIADEASAEAIATELNRLSILKPAKQPLTAGEGVREAIAREVLPIVMRCRRDFKFSAADAADEIADAILDHSTPSPLREDHSADSLDMVGALRAAHLRLESASRAVLDSAQSTYRAKNGQQISIEADDGEMCMIVHSDAIDQLEAALSGGEG